MNMELLTAHMARAGEHEDQRAMWMADPATAKLQASNFRVTAGLGSSTTADGSEMLAVKIMSVTPLPVTAFSRNLMKGNPSLVNKCLALSGLSRLGSGSRSKKHPPLSITTQLLFSRSLPGHSIHFFDLWFSTVKVSQGLRRESVL